MIPWTVTALALLLTAWAFAGAAGWRWRWHPVRWLAVKLRDRVSRRPPDVCIGGDGTPAGCYMRRWWVIPRNRRLNVYLHCFQHDDDDRAFHDHPWWNFSYLIEGRYTELTPCGTFHRKAGDWAVRKATDRHRVVLPETMFEGEIAESWRGLPPKMPCWTIFVTGPNVRTWGFWCKHRDGSDRFVDWKTFTGQDHNRTGKYDHRASRGCGED